MPLHCSCKVEMFKAEFFMQGGRLLCLAASVTLRYTATL